MKQILVLFIAIVAFCSCEKRYNYECTIVHGSGAVGTSYSMEKVQKHCSEDAIERFIKRNNTYDKLTECTKK